MVNYLVEIDFLQLGPFDEFKIKQHQQHLDY